MVNSLNATTLAARIDAYFTACDETAERVTLKNGSVSCRQTPYTLAGLSEALKVSQAEIREKADQVRSCTGRLYADAMRRIERYTVERALLGELQYSVAAMLLRELGSGDDKLPPDESDNRIVIVLEDPEGWSE
ncbi:MAG: terminase small subunit [Clostridia bacterium]